MLTQDQKEQFSSIFEEIGNSLDITEEQYNSAVKSYKAVGTWLSNQDSLLKPYMPQILPQGSFLLGTVIKPVVEGSELDLDLVCQLNGKGPDWTQKILKQKVGTQLKSNKLWEKLLIEPDGRRCWTLQYSDSAKFHMDILPAIISNNYSTILEKAFTDKDVTKIEDIALSITDKKLYNYNSSVRPEEWLKSNPFGYAIWFENQARLTFEKAIMLSESIKPVPKFSKDKLPLQRVVQILKRHRDIKFGDDEHKPISIIITTLAAQAYNKEINVIDALLNVVDDMLNHIEVRTIPGTLHKIKWISNPVNEQENFADKWPENQKKEENFYQWHAELKKDIEFALDQRGGLNKIQEALEKPFGKDTITKAFSNYSDNMLKQRTDGNLKMASGSGILGALGTAIKGHSFHGEE